MIKINVRAAKPVLAVSGRHEVRGEHGEPIGHRGSHRNGAATDSPDGLPQQRRRMSAQNEPVQRSCRESASTDFRDLEFWAQEISARVFSLLSLRPEMLSAGGIRPFVRRVESFGPAL